MSHISCTNRLVIIRRDKNARGGLVVSSQLWAASTDDVTLEDARAWAAQLQAEAEPVDGAAYVEVEAVEL